MKLNKLALLGTLGVVLTVFAALVIMNKRDKEALVEATPRADVELLIRSHSPIKGNPEAPVTIVEFLDPECEACRAMHPIMKRLLAEYDGKIRLVIRYMPLHGNAKLAASALEEAREQGKYDEALDALFENQPAWGDHHDPQPNLIMTYLKDIGVKGRLDASALVAKHGEKVNMDHVDGNRLGVKWTPTFFVNGKMLEDIGYEPIKAEIEKALQESTK